MGTTISPFVDRAEGEIIVQRSGSAEHQILSWVGLDYTDGVEHGFASAQETGPHIIYLDFVRKVDLQVSYGARIQVCNAADNDGNAAGYLTFVY